MAKPVDNYEAYLALPQRQPTMRTPVVGQVFHQNRLVVAVTAHESHVPHDTETVGWVFKDPTNNTLFRALSA